MTQRLRVLTEVEYTTTDAAVTLQQMEDADAPQDWPRTFWTWRDSNGMGPGISSLHDRHVTQDDAIRNFEDWERIRVVNEAIPASYDSRGDYEAACRDAGVEAMSDADIERSSYALKFGDFRLSECGADHIIGINIARARYYALEKAREVRAAKARAERTLASPRTVRKVRKCLICGQYADMNASLGPACADHYDELSD